ncbi:MAG: HAD hydrolase family protein, partial [Bacteroidota bacterium]
MIQALVLDIDGVLIGEKVGFNTPNPNELVIKRLRHINKLGIKIILCTAKPHYSIESIIKSANLQCPHIAYAGGVIINPLDNTIIESHPIPKKIVKNILKVCKKNNFYTELYTLNEYYVERLQVSPLTTVHSFVLQRDALQVDSLADIADSLDVYKIMPIVANESGILPVNDALLPFTDTVMTSWG